MATREPLDKFVKLAQEQAERAETKLLQIYSIARLLGRFDSLEHEDPPDLSSHDVLRMMVLFADQLNEVADDLAGLIADLRRAGNQEPLAQVNN